MKTNLYALVDPAAQTVSLSRRRRSFGPLPELTVKEFVDHIALAVTIGKRRAILAHLTSGSPLVRVFGFRSEFIAALDLMAEACRIDETRRYGSAPRYEVA